MRKQFQRGAVALVIGCVGSVGSALEFQGPNGTKATFYGQLSIGWLSFDEGQDSESSVVDKANANGRVGLNIDWTFANDTKLRFILGTALGLLQSSARNTGIRPI